MRDIGLMVIDMVKSLLKVLEYFILQTVLSMRDIGKIIKKMELLYL
jgi:hypothetical protein